MFFSRIPLGILFLIILEEQELAVLGQQQNPSTKVVTYSGAGPKYNHTLPEKVSSLLCSKNRQSPSLVKVISKRETEFKGIFISTVRQYNGENSTDCHKTVLSQKCKLLRGVSIPNFQQNRQRKPDLSDCLDQKFGVYQNNSSNEIISPPMKYLRLFTILSEYSDVTVAACYNSV